MASDLPHDDITNRLASLSGEKRALLSLALQDSEGDFNTFPLSFAQERLWFLEQMWPGHSAYHLPFGLRLRGPLNLAALEQSLNEITRRHEALRTTVIAVGGQAAQAPLAVLRMPIPVVDMQALAPPVREDEWQRRAYALAQASFDLAQGPLWRVVLFRLADDEHIFLVTLHHLVADGGSLAIFLRELETLYNAFTHARRSPLAEPALQYVDFAGWQREGWEAEGAFAESLEYWRRELDGAPASLDLPADRARPAARRWPAGRVPVRLPPSLTRALQGLSAQEGATLFMTLLAAFQVLLYRWTRQTDLVVGSPVANRQQPEFEGLIGLFVNMLALRTRPSGSLPFREFLRRTRDACLGAYARQEVPVEKLAERLQVDRDLNRSPLFQVVFVWQNALPVPAFEGLSASLIEIPLETAKFDLTLSLWMEADEVRGVWEYDRELFERSTIARLSGHFTTLLQAVAARPGQRLAELPLLGEDERRQLLVDWNATRAETPVGCVHEWVSAQAARTPDAIALGDGDHFLTYRLLNARANAFARRLQAGGVGPDSLVALYLERSLDVVIGALSVLKAGGAYVSLDLSVPAERLAFMLRDTGVPVLLTHSALRLPAGVQVPSVITMDTQPFDDEDEADLPGGVTPDNLAYVIYTSGSTGRPKGSLLTHAGLSNLVAWHLRTYQLLPEHRSTQVTGLTFDVSVWEVWPYLAAGASLHIVPNETRADPARLLDWLLSRQITFTFLTTPLAEAVLKLPWPDDVPLRALLTGGDQLHGPTSVAGRVRVVNHYGPSEATVIATWWSMEGAALAEPLPPIGRPIANAQVYILDERLQPVPVGVVGELYLGGINLGRGYLNRPDLTAEKFVPNPFAAPTPSPLVIFPMGEGVGVGDRLYKTGDLARYRPDGAIEFLGRADYQVKVRGFRIELGEIEARLSEHPGVASCVVVAHREAGGDKRLVAYVVAREAAAAPTNAELRRHLKERLPDPMVPAVFIRLEALPLNASGKVDRRVLPAPDAADLARLANFVAPRTPTEELVANLWADVLGLEQCGVFDNFFELGGHSLRVTQVMARLHDLFGGERLLRDLFEAPTVAELAQRIDAAPRALDGGEGPPLLPAERRGPQPLSFAQQRLWFLEKLAPGSPAYNIPAAVRLKGRFDVSALRAGLLAVVDRHEILRTTFTVEAEPAQHIWPGVEVPFALVDLRALPEPAAEAEAQRQAAALARAPFDLGRGPLIRVTVWRLGPADHLLAVAMHHIVSDGWSAGVLIREMSALYSALTRGERAPLEALPVQYADYAAWQRQWLDGPASERQLAYWKQQLADLPVLALPTDRPRPPVQTMRGATLTFTCPPPLTESLRRLSRRAGVTLFMTLVAAFQTLLYRYTGQLDIALGTPVANRRRTATEGLIGFFVNMLVLRTRLSGRSLFSALLQRVRETCLAAYAHQDVPFEQVVDALRPQRDLSHPPLFQVAIALQNASLPPLDAVDLGPGLALYPVELDTGTAKFELTLNLAETDEGLRGSIEYNADLFEADTIARLAGHWQTLLSEIVTGPDRRLDELPLLTPAEARHLLGRWHDTRAVYPAADCLHRRFEAQAGRTPDAVAVTGDGLALTYAALNRRANQLAHRLQALGVGPESRVGLCLERSIEMVVGILGTLKAGGAYVPFDPTYPPERLAFMARDAGLLAVVTQQALLEKIPHLSLPRLCLDTDGHPLDLENAHDLDSPAQAEGLAYVIYTSGSTGRPKGVLVTHASVARLFDASAAWYHFDAGDVWTLFHSYAFDFSVWELWGALLHGGRLVVVSHDASRSPQAFYDLLEREQVTVLNQTPSAFRQLVAHEAAMHAPATLGLRLVIFGGEALDVQSLRPWFERHGDQHPRLVNMYGITETTVHVTYRPLTAADLDRASGSRIGLPIPDLALYILDPTGRQPMPVGIPGELYVGGAGVARGYLYRPDLTAEKFVPNPFAASNGVTGGARLYRTGDLARHLPDGDIEYLGRLDHQVKLRGFRIELGEIEAVLAQHPGVQEAVVLLRDAERGGEKRLAAYAVPQPSAALTTADLRNFLKARLPDYMLPAAFMLLPSFPLTPNGKVDRGALPRLDAGRPELETAYVAPRTRLEETLSQLWREVLQVERVGIHDNFFDLGGHSLLLVRLHGRLREALQHDIPVVDLFRHPTIHALARSLDREQALPSVPPQAAAPERYGGDIAIVGMAGRFPRAATPEAFWQNLRDGVEAISFFSAGELAEAGVSPDLFNRPDYVGARGTLEAVEWFDARFFGLTPREAELMDPQHRLFLESAWAALEDAGYDSETYAGRIGLYAGASPNGYLLFNLYSRDLAHSPDGFQTLIANHGDALATRAAYKLNLKGPGINVQTACSTSLVAVSLACQSLLARQCDMALAGGVSIGIPQKTGYVYQEGGIHSPDGHCRAFDAGARGTVGGDGVGVVVLKRLDDALRDGDSIHALVKGFAINNDGSLKVGYTAPSVAGQAAVIADALAMAGVHPETITLVEAHGTGTPLGDPVEIAALTEAYRAHTDQKRFCAIGSVKSNIGHLDAAAGIAGLIKTVLSLKHQAIPPSLHVECPNPAIDFAGSPFYVNTALKEWPAGSTPRRAAVSSFGIGGTNAHVILEEAPPSPPSPPSPPWHLLVLSAKTGPALEAATTQLGDYLRHHPDASLADVAYTLQVGRRAFDRRRVLVCRDTAEALAALDAPGAGWLPAHRSAPRERPLVFMFPGQGTQHLHMGAGLYQTSPVLREQVDGCAGLLRPHLGLDLREVLYPDPERVEASAALINQTWIAQPALFVIEYALAQLWLALGQQPRAMIGHSIGEYVAACLAGVFSLEDALHLVAARGRLIQAQPAGLMLAVALGEHDLRPFLNGRLSLAAVNGPAACVVAGEPEAVEAFERQLLTRDIACRRLVTSHAFHSTMMDPALEAFAGHVQKIPLHAPQRRYLSNVTGTWITTAEATDPAYWVRHLRQTVRFAEGLEVLLQQPDCVLLEVGPGQALGRLARRHPRRSEDQIVLGSLPSGQDPQPEAAFWLNTLGRLWLDGAQVDWAALHQPERRRRLPLPTYPFDRQRYWVAPRVSAGLTPAASPPPISRRDLADWLYIPSWKRSVLSSPITVDALMAQPLVWLVFVDEAGLGRALVEFLEAAGQVVVSVSAGQGWAKLGHTVYTIVPGRAEDYERLLSELQTHNAVPTRVVHLWNVTAEAAPTDVEFLEQAQVGSFYSLLYLAQALARIPPASSPIEIKVVSNGMQRVAGERAVCPEKALALGPCRVIPQEYPHLACQSIDVVRPASRRGWEDRLWLEMLAADLAAPTTDPVLAYRDRDRWVQTFEPLSGVEMPGRTPRLRQGGVYLITGGFGGIGLTLAGALARSVQARLVLVGRSPVPDRAGWADWPGAHPDQPGMGEMSREILKLESYGAEVLPLSADVTRPDQMRSVIAQAVERFGALHGVVHAAGIPGGEVMQLKTAAAAEAVLAPKVQGARALEAVLEDVPLDFFVLCSALASLTGSFGQVDYCAANAFLDAFAHQYAMRHDVDTVAVNWDTWQQVGMAEKAAARLRPGASRAGPNTVHHQTTLHPAKDWVLAEHRLLGRPVLPATAYLEMARAAFARQLPHAAVELSDVLLLAPLVVEGEEEVDVRVVLEGKDGSFDFRISSREAAGQGAWREHAQGRLGPRLSPDPAPYPLAQLLLAHRAGALDPAGPASGAVVASSWIEAGPRWQNARQVFAGASEGLACLELPPAFAGDLDHFALHPALLDVATSFGVGQAGAGQAYLPLSYRRVIVHRPLPRVIYSHAVQRRPGTAAHETLSFDVTLVDETGSVCVTVEDFTLKRVTAFDDGRAKGSTLPGVSWNPEDILREAITPQEGVEAFERILGWRGLTQVVVSTRSLTARIEAARSLTGLRLAESADFAVRPAAHARPDLQTPYAAPQGETEQRLARIWNDVLGIRQIGRHDNFFELGGDSLAAVQLLPRLRRAFPVELPLAALFETPTIAALAEHLDTAETSIPSLAPPIRPVPRSGVLPLSFAQQRLWLLDQLLPNSPAYNIPTAVQLDGPIDLAALARSLNQIVRRHDVLRTTFGVVDGQPVQVVAPALTLPLTVIDLQTLPKARREKTAWQLIEAEARTPFDLSRGPLMRWLLIRSGGSEHIFLLNVHHIVFDGWSTGVFLRELAAAYPAFVSGRAPALPDLPIQYADFAVWQRQWLSESTLEAQLAYWKRQLAGLPASDLPTDYARPAGAEGQGAISAFMLPRELIESLRTLSQQAEVTLFMTLVAALHVLLRWYSGQADVAIGTGVANRHQVETEGLIGFFVNVLVLRSSLSGNPTFREVLARVRALCLDAYARQDLPFEKLVEELQVGRELSRNPFYQLTFALQNTPMPTLDMADLRLTAMDVDPGTARSDLVLNMLETPEGLRGALRYRSDLFSADTMARLSGGLAAILQAVVARPEVTVDALIEQLTALDGDHRIKRAESLAEIRRQKFSSTRRRAIGRP